MTVRLGGAGQITNIVNDQGATASSATAVYLPDYPPADTTPPTLTLTSVPAAPSLSGWYTTPVIVSIAASDDYTPGPTVVASLDGAAPNPVTGPITIPDGQHTLTVTATDASGNVTTATWTGRVDTTPPTTTSDATDTPTTSSDTPSGSAAPSGSVSIAVAGELADTGSSSPAALSAAGALAVLIGSALTWTMRGRRRATQTG
ncbi:LPXTG cell wall anchor domain-containing protein [Leifsonia sp. EB34]|uniref:LPXTG cell wall anchor domain-containing protein n=1 Tax=Leifsonia sp. EB34 TaxID=3156303 RepID=UPI0035139F23